MGYTLILTTASSLNEARRIADLLLNQRLAACVTISSQVESHYWWKSKKEKGREVVLLIKTKAKVFPKLEKLIRENHSYSIPEIIALPIHKASKKYLDWLAKEVF